ncbi:hypothetical protein, partial [Acinetobacter baumannii]|uniref:hypothetical protein n=3 Tax=Pseudomonadota TaxID=1224 RepID=UPI00163C0B78
MEIKSYVPTTNKSLLVFKEFRGLPLPLDKHYRQNNIFKASTVLGLALEKKQSCYVFEIYSDNLDYFTSKLKQLDSEAKYLKLEIES